MQPGLFGIINIPGSLPYEGVLIPDSAISADQDRRIVYRVDGEGKVSPQQIRPGPRLHGYRVVRDGLTGEESIVINGLMRRSDEHTSDLQPLTRISNAVFCSQKTNSPLEHSLLLSN